MGDHYSVYHFYGVHVPRDQWSAQHLGTEAGLLDETIRAVNDIAPDVGWLAAGDYCQDALFLCISRPDGCIEIELGKFLTVHPRNVPDHDWDIQLTAVTRTMGYKELNRPEWIICPDLS